MLNLHKPTSRFWILAIIFTIALVPSSCEQDLEIQTIKKFPKNIIVQNNTSVFFDLDQYYTGFNISFSLVPNRVKKIASLSAPAEAVPAVKVIPLTMNDVFTNKSTAGSNAKINSSFALLRQNGSLEIIQVVTINDHNSIVANSIEWKFLPAPVQCFDLVHASEDMLVLDCLSENQTDLLIWLNFSSSNKCDVLQYIQNSSTISNISERSISFLRNSDGSTNIFRIQSNESNFRIDKFTFYNWKVISSSSYVAIDTMPNFKPKFMLAFEKIILLFDSEGLVTTNNSEIRDTITPLSNYQYLIITNIQSIGLPYSAYSSDRINLLANSGGMLSSGAVWANTGTVANTFFRFWWHNPNAFQIAFNTSNSTSYFVIYQDSQNQNYFAMQGLFDTSPLFYSKIDGPVAFTRGQTWVFPAGDNCTTTIIGSQGVVTYHVSPQILHIDKSMAKGPVTEYNLTITSREGERSVTRIETFNVIYDKTKEDTKNNESSGDMLLF